MTNYQRDREREVVECRKREGEVGVFKEVSAAYYLLILLLQEEREVNEYDIVQRDESEHKTV